MAKRSKRKLSFLEDWALRISAPPLIFLLKCIPLSWIYPVGWSLALLGRRTLGQRQKIAMANLRLVLGQRKSEKQLRDIYHRFLARTVIGTLEIVKFALLPSRMMIERIDIVGREHLDEVRKSGHGAIAVSIHLGNFTLLGPRLIEEDFPFAFIFKYPKNQEMTRLVCRYRDAVGLRFIDGWAKKTSAQESIRHLRQGGILCMLVDQNPPDADIMVEFFGYPVPSFRGPVVLSARTDAPIIPLFMVAGDKGHYTLFVEKPFTIPPHGQREDDATAVMSEIMKRAEIYIERYPDQWWWWHRRWKKHVDYKHL